MLEEAHVICTIFFFCHPPVSVCIFACIEPFKFPLGHNAIPIAIYLIKKWRSPIPPLVFTASDCANHLGRSHSSIAKSCASEDILDGKGIFGTCNPSSKLL